MLTSIVITDGGLAVAFVIFLLMALEEVKANGLAAIRQFKLQLTVATFVWLLGESVSLFYTSVPRMELMIIHTISMGLYAMIVLARMPSLIRK